MSDYFSHHGVKDMKWGVRKDKDKVHRQSAISGYTEVAKKNRTTEKTVDTKSSQGVSKSQIISLDPDGSIREVGRRALSAWDINESQKNLKVFR